MADGRRGPKRSLHLLANISKLVMPVDSLSSHTKEMTILYSIHGYSLKSTLVNLIHNTFGKRIGTSNLKTYAKPETGDKPNAELFSMLKNNTGL